MHAWKISNSVDIFGIDIYGTIRDSGSPLLSVSAFKNVKHEPAYQNIKIVNEMSYCHT